MKYWFYGRKDDGWGWREITEAAYRDSMAAIDYWRRRDGLLPTWLDGCKVIESETQPTHRLTTEN